jgi:hypothetical protein
MTINQTNNDNNPPLPPPVLHRPPTSANTKSAPRVRKAIIPEGTTRLDRPPPSLHNFAIPNDGNTGLDRQPTNICSHYPNLYNCNPYPQQQQQQQWQSYPNYFYGMHPPLPYRAMQQSVLQNENGNNNNNSGGSSGDLSDTRGGAHRLGNNQIQVRHLLACQ